VARTGSLWVLIGCLVALTGNAAMTGVRAQERGDAKAGAMGKPAKNDAFGSKNWKPAPPPKKVVKAKPVAQPVAAPPPPPPAPTAPALPFTYLGRMVDAGVTTVFLAQQHVSLAVKTGDTINNVYRVDQITDTTVSLTYLPLNAKQQLNLGGPR